MNTPARIETSEITLTDDQKDICGVSSIQIKFHIPAIYDDMENVDNIKISERFPKFGFGDLLDEILEDFGGVLDIFQCEWNEDIMEGEVVCLMKDWRVFRYLLKQNEMASLTRDERIRVINKDCIVFEDIDEWSSWKEVKDDKEENKKILERNKEAIEKNKQEAEEYVSDLNDFFSGNFDKIQKKMQQNKGI